MERRNFLKISALTGVAATLDACHAPDKQLIRFVQEEYLVPGIATIKPGICTLCSAGCGLEVRVMQGDAEVVRNGQTGIIKMGLAKKLEGNPRSPVNKGKLRCSTIRTASRTPSSAPARAVQASFRRFPGTMLSRKYPHTFPRCKHRSRRMYWPFLRGLCADNGVN